MFLIEITKKENVPDAEGNDTLHGIADLQIAAESVRVDQVYLLEGRLKPSELKHIAEMALVDPIIEDYSIRKIDSLPAGRKFPGSEKSSWSVLKTFHHGVTDNVGQTTLEAIRNLGVRNVDSVMTGKRYRISGGTLSFDDAGKIASRLLANPLIESFVIEKIRA